MQLSVIIITKDEQPRLRLCLASLARQSLRSSSDVEMIIVDDGSAVPVGAADLAPGLEPRILRHDTSRGRSAARNAGAAASRGRRLLFLDGDVLLSPEALFRHAALGDGQLGRGEQRHLRSTRFFRDPRTGEPWPGRETRVRSMGNLAPLLVTEDMPFDELLARSDVAIYPGAAPRQLYELETGALRRGSAPRAEWIAASGHNFSVPSGPFAAAGGFDGEISINEHRELALRLCRRGARVVLVEGAVSLHVTHREGWRDPLAEPDWEQAFARRHPLETELMLRFFRTLAGKAEAGERLASLEEVDAVLQRAGAR